LTILLLVLIFYNMGYIFENLVPTPKHKMGLLNASINISMRWLVPFSLRLRCLPLLGLMQYKLLFSP